MRRTIALGSVIIGAVLSAGLATGDDWTQFHGPNRENMSKETGLARSFGKGGPPQLWTVEVGRGYGGASVQGMEVFILDRVDDAKDILRCLDLKSGKENWRVEFKAPGRLPYNGSRAVPTIAKKHIFACGPFGHLYAVDRKTRKKAWTVDMMSDFQGRVPRFGFSHSPLLHKNLVIAAPLGTAGIVAFNQDTGKVVWKTKGFGGQTYQSCVMRNLAGTDMITYQSGGTLVGVNPDDGKVLWTYNGYRARNPIPEATTVGKDKLFLTCGYGSGSKLIKITKVGKDFVVSESASINQEGSQIHPAIFHKGHLYANFNRNRNLRREETMGLVCIDLKGKILWQTSGSPSFNRGAVIYADGMLICVGGEDGYIRLVEPSPKGYKEIASAKIFSKTLKRRNNEIWCPVALSNGHLLVRNHSVLKCINLSKSASGTKKGSSKEGSKKRRFR